MNDRIDVIEVLRRANPVPPDTIDMRAVPTAEERRASLRAVPTTGPTTPSGTDRGHRRRGWPRYAAAAAAAVGVVALGLVQRNQADPVRLATTADTGPATTAGTDPRVLPPGSFVGIWVSADVDSSSKMMQVARSGNGEYEIVVRDGPAWMCSGGRSTMTGAARPETDETLVIAQPVVVCDDGSAPAPASAPSLPGQLINLTFTHDSATDELADSLGVVWRRAQMWPQSSMEEVHEAQRLADARDPGFTWQISPELARVESPEDAELFARFLREKLGWEKFRFADFAGGEAGDGAHDGLVFVRCAPGRTNALYPEFGGCAPTIDESRFETVRISANQPDRRGSAGIWVVSRWETIQPVEQVTPPSDAEATAFLQAFLAARVDGEGAEQYVQDDDIPLEYAATTGAPYERFEFQPVGGPVWPFGEIEYTVRLFADGGATVVEQSFTMSRDATGRLEVDISLRDDVSTRENGQALYSLLEGEVTFAAAPPWETCCWSASESPTLTTLTYERFGSEGFAVAADLQPVGPDCQTGPAPADAAELARSIRSDPDLEATEPITVRIAGLDALQIDVVAAQGASVCDGWGIPMVLGNRVEDGVGVGNPEVLRGVPLAPGDRMRLYLLDLPEASARVLAVAIFAPDAQFDHTVAAASPLVDSLELHTS